MRETAEQAPVQLPIYESMEDAPKDKCGVAAVWDPNGNAAHITYLALKALQHRGQDGSGVSFIEGNPGEDLENPVIKLRKALGRVAIGFREGKDDALLNDVDYTVSANGHDRYGTTDAKEGEEFDALQPIIIERGGEQYSIAHNGQFDMITLDRLSARYGAGWHGTDSERFADLLGASIEEHGELEPAMMDLLPELEGAFSLTIQSKNGIYGIRDRHGVRPLVVGKDGDSRMIASEVCALKAPDKDGNRQLEYKLEKIVKPGTFVLINQDGIQESRWAEPDLKPCIFEDIYLSKPDNVMLEDGPSAADYRTSAGMILARKERHASDMVVPVLGSAKTYAKGYEAASLNMPYVEALLKNPDRKNPDSDRTFIETTQEAREAAVRDKFMVDADLVDGKDVTLIDDSLVRGTTTKVIIEMLREAGARRVHVRIGSPVYTNKCSFGVNVQSEKELLSYNRTVAEMAEVIGADSLEFLSRNEMYEAKGVSEDEVCSGCMGGNYPDKRQLTVADILSTPSLEPSEAVLR